MSFSNWNPIIQILECASHKLIADENKFKETEFLLKTPCFELTETDEQAAKFKADSIVQASQQKYGVSKKEVESLIYESIGKTGPTDKAATATPVKSKKQLLGRGGKKHKELQQRIKKLGEEAGFRSTIEKPIRDANTGHVDVALERDDVRIACEISVKTNAKHELKNVGKCLADGFDIVFLVVNNQKINKTENY